MDKEYQTKDGRVAVLYKIYEDKDEIHGAVTYSTGDMLTVAWYLDGKIKSLVGWNDDMNLVEKTWKPNHHLLTEDDLKKVEQYKNFLAYVRENKIENGDYTILWDSKENTYDINMWSSTKNPPFDYKMSKESAKELADKLYSGRVKF